MPGSAVWPGIVPGPPGGDVILASRQDAHPLEAQRDEREWLTTMAACSRPPWRSEIADPSPCGSDAQARRAGQDSTMPYASWILFTSAGLALGRIAACSSAK